MSAVAVMGALLGHVLGPLMGALLGHVLGAVLGKRNAFIIIFPIKVCYVGSCNNTAYFEFCVGRLLARHHIEVSFAFCDDIIYHSIHIIRQRFIGFCNVGKIYLFRNRFLDEIVKILLPIAQIVIELTAPLRR